MPRSKRISSERGSAFVEFLLCSIVWLPILLGTLVFGTNIVEAIQVNQLCRDTAHMYAYGIDFSQAQNVAMLGRIASPLGITQGAGKGAIVFSTITLATGTDCNAANLNVCPNRDKYVFTSIYVYGNQALANTKLGNPPSRYLTNGVGIVPATYLTDPNLVATDFDKLLQFIPDQPGQYAYVSEVSYKNQAFAWSEFSNTGIYARSIF
jgi:hypothetical protein